MSGEPAADSPDPDPGAAQPKEIDAQELLDATYRAIAAVRRQAAGLFGVRPRSRAESGEQSDNDEPPGP